MSKTLSGNARAAIVAAALLLPLTLAGNSFAEDPAAITITLKDDAFSPAEVKVPAGKAFTLKFANKDAAAAEIEAKDLKIETVNGDARLGDLFLLASDGLTRLVNDAELATELTSKSPTDAAESLVAAALARGAPDNVTMVITKVT